MPQTTINVEALQDWLEQQKPVTLLDVRHANEWAEWTVPGSIHVDAYDALRGNDPNALARVDLPRDRPVVTICGAGRVSLTAAEQLRARGFEALSLDGGMKAWSLAWNSAEVPLSRGTETRLIQVRRTGKGCLSYLIGSNGVAAIIDPALEPDLYLGLAQNNGWSISHIVETHVHADHLSRGRMLAKQAGATLYLPAQDRVVYPFEAVHDNNVLNIGGARLVALHTPGHTGESTCYLLDDQALFTGDTLFLTAVGRPDLEAGPGEARTRAHALYHSLQRLLSLPTGTLILPGHSSEPIPFDGRPVAAPLVQVREEVALLHLPEDEFVELLLARIPPTPPNHQRIVQLNEAGLIPDGDPTDLEAGANRCAVA